MKVAQTTLEPMHCRLCEHIAYGENHASAIHALAAHVKACHPEVAAQVKRLAQYGSDNVIPLHREDAG